MPTDDSLNAKKTISAPTATHTDDIPDSSLPNDPVRLDEHVLSAPDTTMKDLQPTWGDTIPLADIKLGDVVVLLGVGVGERCVGTRALVGEAGHVIGIDTAPTLFDRAHQNAEAPGYANIEYMPGSADAIPLPGGMADVVVSNNALSGISDWQAAVDESYRILKPNGRSCLTQLVLTDGLPVAVQELATQYVGGVALVPEQMYLDSIEMAGFENVQVRQRNLVRLPDELLKTHLTDTELVAFRESGAGVISLTSCAQKAGDEIPDVYQTNADAATETDSDEDDLDDLKGFDFLGRL